MVINVTDGGVGLTRQLLEKLRAEFLVDEVGCVGWVLVLEPVVAAAEGQLTVTDKTHFARAVSTTPVMTVLVATVVMEVVVLVDDRESIALGAAERHVDRRVCQHPPPPID